jgi:hypothetical protein
MLDDSRDRPALATALARLFEDQFGAAPEHAVQIATDVLRLTCGVVFPEQGEVDPVGLVVQ